VDFGKAVSQGISNITNFSGRTSRAGFWWFILGLWIAALVVNVLASVVFQSSIVSFLLWLVFVLAFLSVSFRRLQDVGQNGWLSLLSFIPCIGLILIYFWVQPSNPGDNQYGPQPAA